MYHTYLPSYPSQNRLYQELFDGYFLNGQAIIVDPFKANRLVRAFDEVSDLFKLAMHEVLRDPKRLSRFVFSDDSSLDFSIKEIIRNSWHSQPDYLIDRYDFAWDGGDPKILERNFGWLGLVIASGLAQEEYADWLTHNCNISYNGSIGSMSMFDHLVQTCSVWKKRSQILDNKQICVCAPDSSLDQEMHLSGVFLAECFKRAGLDPIIMTDPILSYSQGRLYVQDRYLKRIEIDDMMAKKLKLLLEKFDFDELRELTGCAGSKRFLYIKLYTLLKIYEDHFQPNGAVLIYDESQTHQVMVIDGGIFTFGASDDLIALMAEQRLKDDTSFEYTPSLNPPWTALAGHKGMLAELYDLYPRCPYIPPTVWGRDGFLNHKRVVKPVDSCQGMGCAIIDKNGRVLHDKGYVDSDSRNAHVSQLHQQQVDDALRFANIVFNGFTTNARLISVGSRVSPKHKGFVGGSTETRYLPVLTR